MTNKWRTGILVSLGVAIGASLSLANSVFALRSTNVADSEIATFTQVLSKVREQYVESVDDKDLFENAINGMLAGLDPHSAFLNEEDFKEINIHTSGKFGGLGIEVTMRDGFVKVVTPIDDTPAQRAGIQAGDLIIRLDDKTVKGMSLRDAVNVMRGEPDTDIKLTVVREGVDIPLNIIITRDIIKIESVKSRMLENDYGYVRITTFQNNTGRSVDEAIEKLHDENDKKLKGLVLDLRNNPGGVLNASVDVSSVFLNDGLVVYIQGRETSTRRNYNAKRGDAMNGAPIVVLVNEGSASASEIVAGALQDHQRAIIMGRKTFGKGSVQSVLPLHNGTAIKLTTARYYTPKGRSIQAEGIAPDITIEPLKVSAQKNNEFARLKERDLKNSLSNGQQQAIEAAKAEAENKDGEKAKQSLAEKDYDLYQALNLLKGLSIAKQSAR